MILPILVLGRREFCGGSNVDLAGSWNSAWYQFNSVA